MFVVLRRIGDVLSGAWSKLFHSDSSRNSDAGRSARDREASLIAAAQRGGVEGRAAFRTLVEDHQRWLVWFLTCLLSNQADAEDVAQEVFVRAFLALDRFRGDSRFRTWIRRIALNQAFNHKRAQRRRVQDEGFDAAEVGEKDVDYGGIIAREALLSCLDELPYISREILVLFHVEEMALQDISENLDIGLSAAKMRLKRAREQFKQLYEESTAEVVP